MRPIYLATGNAHKAREFQQMFVEAGVRYKIESAASLGGMPPVAETAGSFAGNALLKVYALARAAPSDALVLADDSGLKVAALDGAPGIFSARYAGPGATDADNTAKHLREMAAVPEGSRTARFVCVLALSEPDGNEHLFTGECPGRIGFAPSGGGGFGYDPVFYPEGFDKSFAELGDDIKNGLSHRARALEKLFKYLRNPNPD